MKLTNWTSQKKSCSSIEHFHVRNYAQLVSIKTRTTTSTTIKTTTIIIIIVAIIISLLRTVWILDRAWLIQIYHTLQVNRYVLCTLQMFHFTCKYSNHLQVFVKGIGEEREQVSSFSTRKFNSLQPIELKCASALELTWIKRIQQSSYEFITQERRVLDLLRLSLYLFCTVQFYFMSTDNAAELSSLCAWCGA